MPDFGGIEPNGFDQVQERQRRIERGVGVGLAEMPQKTQDQPRCHAARTGIVKRPGDAGDDRLERDPALGMALRIKENLDMAHGIGFGAAQIGIG